MKTFNKNTTIKVSGIVMTNGKNADVDLVDPQGYRANLSGRQLEKEIATILKKKGAFISYWRLKDKVNEEKHNHILYKCAPYISNWGCKCRGEFVFKSKKIDGAVRIEARAQHVAGSVDEKLNYLKDNCGVFEEPNVIVVLEGDGFRKEARPWFKKQIKAISHKNVRVMDLNEFETWVNDNI